MRACPEFYGNDTRCTPAAAPQLLTPTLPDRDAIHDVVDLTGLLEQVADPAGYVRP
jgi:hypothetical protein